MARGTNQTKHKGLSYTKFGYLFIAPFIIVYCLFSLYPLLTTFWYSGSSMTSTTAQFWGFGDKEIYYDEYLDLVGVYGDDFADATGLDKANYMLIRNYFATYDAAKLYNPMSENGLNAIINNSDLSQPTKDLAKKALDSGNPSELINNADAISELTAWRKGFSDLTVDITNSLGGLNNTLTAIVSPEVSDEETTTEEEPITADTIKASEEYAAFLETIQAADFDEGQQLLVDYLCGYTGTSDLYTYFSDAGVNVDDPVFYFVCVNLSSPKATIGEGEDAESINSIAVPFMSDLETYLKTETWPSSISSLASYNNFAAYADMSKDLHEDEDQLLADLTSLYEMGLLNSKVALVEQDGALVQSEVSKENLLASVDTFIKTEYQSDEDKVMSAMYIGNLNSYINTQGRMMLLASTPDIDNYISFSDELDRDLYKSFKAKIGMDSVLTLEKYEAIDASYKQAQVDKAEANKAENEAALPAAQAAYDAAKGTDGEKSALEALRTIENAIDKAKQTISNPKSIFAKANGKTEFLFVGLDNYSQIFANKTRRDTVIGAFVNTFILWIIGFTPQILLALLLSAWFTDNKLKLKGLGLMKGLMYLPNVITAVTVAIFFRRVFGYSNGGAKPVAQQILALFGDKDGYNFFIDPWATRLIVCFVNFWMWYGNTMIVLIAGITSINESLYESAQIDGANSFQTYTKITMPLLRPILLYSLVTSMIGGLQMYDIPQNLNQNPAQINFNGTMVSSIQTVLMYVNKQAFGKQDIKQVGLASAVSIMLFIVTTILSIVVFYLMRDKDAAKAAKAKKLARKAGAVR